MAEIPNPERISPESNGELQEALTRDPTTGRFLPGHSGNPRGRPPGRWNEALHALVPKAIAAIEGALDDGDMSAVGHLLARTVPPLKPESDIAPFDLDTNTSVVDQCRQVLKAAADGKITFERARQFVDLIGTIKDLGDVEAALDELRRLKRGKTKTGDTMPAGHVFMVDAQTLIGGKP